MDENNRRKILFRIVVDQEHGGFSHASNFITKIVNGEEVTVKDVKGISSRLLPADVSFMWKARLLMDGKGNANLAWWWKTGIYRIFFPYSHLY